MNFNFLKYFYKMVKKALLIGINYKGSDAELRGCINDIRNIRAILMNNCGYLESNIRVLTEEDSIKPTRENIERNINWLITNTMKDDTLVFYYSGHGANVDDKSGDESDKKDEVIVPLDYNTAGVITDDWLYQNMACRIPVGVNLWGFTDCCHSGTMIDLKYNYRSLCTYNKGKVVNGMQYKHEEWTNRFSFSVEKSKDINGSVVFFSGCQDHDVSADAFIKNQSQGAFSYCLIELLKNNLERMPNGSFRFTNGKIKLRNVLKEVNARLDINNFSQNSQLSVSKSTDLERTFDL